jgi:hypothetical protein
MADLFSFDYNLLQSFCSICKSFLFASFMNENEVFSTKKIDVPPINFILLHLTLCTMICHLKILIDVATYFIMPQHRYY